jgi:PhnB protein
VSPVRALDIASTIGAIQVYGNKFLKGGAVLKGCIAGLASPIPRARYRGRRSNHPLAATKGKDSPAKDFMPAFQQEKIVNARLRNGGSEISASDWLRPAQTPIRGNTVCLYLSGGTLEELKTLFEKLSDGAEVTDPLKEQFFGTYGALNDKFGVRWMFQTDKKSLRRTALTANARRTLMVEGARFFCLRKKTGSEGRRFG